MFWIIIESVFYQSVKEINLLTRTCMLNLQWTTTAETKSILRAMICKISAPREAYFQIDDDKCPHLGRHSLVCNVSFHLTEQCVRLCAAFCPIYDIIIMFYFNETKYILNCHFPVWQDKTKLRTFSIILFFQFLSMLSCINKRVHYLVEKQEFSLI